VTRAHIVPALIAAAGERASLRFLEFFAANIRNPHTRRAYSRAVSDFIGSSNRCASMQHQPRSCVWPRCAAAGIAEDRKGYLFRTSRGHTATALSDKPMVQSDAWRMIRRRAVAVGINASIGNHNFRATGITAYLSSGGALEHAQEMAAHESPRTTKLYDRTKERLTQDEVERIRL